MELPEAIPINAIKEYTFLYSKQHPFLNESPEKKSACQQIRGVAQVACGSTLIKKVK